ncbi:uncharacterized protein BDZ99DRAFT_521784 [Mytilinidion resinicola]|uniref:Uncharacterized protein n=1 Tax=Mytilinidion resinicola TaxID=574789 RepID=A0A6A6YHC3_9PEZI|nr:uncharacterized protein BDZ99DRAFT_521784 [Mytilinidion resinicola]KAF2808216.1 hypothetical protein BDZ99DRAFT_521784 [Mytilinidion resinicola]
MTKPPPTEDEDGVNTTPEDETNSTPEDVDDEGDRFKEEVEADDAWEAEPDKTLEGEEACESSEEVPEGLGQICVASYPPPWEDEDVIADSVGVSVAGVVVS